MIEAAKRAYPDQNWLLADVSQWTSSEPVDVIYSNATLQWLPDHGVLMPRLFGMVAAGGALAFQIPSSTYATVRTLIHDISHRPAWSERMNAPRNALTMESPAFYYDALVKLATNLDLWETEYSHVLESAAAIVDWISSTGLRPFLAALETDAEQSRLVRSYLSRLARFTVSRTSHPTSSCGSRSMDRKEERRMSNHVMQQSEYMAMMQGDDGTLGSTELIAAYEQGIDDLRSAVAGMTPEQVLARPIPGKWSTVECVGHLADTEIFFTDRIVRTIAMDRPLLMSPDENLYIERLGYQSFDLDEQLALFTALRRHAVRILRMQPPEAWSRTAVHSESGLLTLRQLVLQAVRHLRHHLPFLAEKRAALGVGKP